MRNDAPTTPDPAIPTLALRPREAAKALGISERALWGFTADGKIPCVTVGRAKLYPIELLQKWLRDQATGGEGRR